MIKLSIQRPVGVWMCFLALTLVGVLGFRRLSVDLLPSITYPRLTVITSYADIPAEDKVGDMLQEAVTRAANEWGPHRLSRAEKRAI